MNAKQETIMYKTRYARLFAAAQSFSALTCLRSLPLGLAGACCIVSLVLPCSVKAQKPQGKGKLKSGTPPPKPAMETGRALFQKNCSPCHGATGQGGEGPNLQKITLTDAVISTTIKKGVKGEMPAFGNKFKEADIKALTAFVHSLKKPK